MTTAAVLRVFLRTVFGSLRQRATRRGLVGARCEAVTAIQRFGSALDADRVSDVDAVPVKRDRLSCGSCPGDERDAAQELRPRRRSQDA